MSLSEKITNMPKYTKIGFFGPLIALSTIAIAILLSPAIVFNGGLIVTSILMLLFTFWFLKWTKDIPTKIGLIPLIISLVFLIGIGVLSENFPPFHYWVSVGFFLTFPFSMWFIGIGWLRFSKLRLFSILSLLLPFLSVYMWTDVMIGTPIWENVAIPELYGYG